jgi:hypothetical protein
MPSKGARTSVRRSCCWALTTRARCDQLALCGVAAALGVVERLHRGHALRLQGLQALDLALRLVEGLLSGARTGVCRLQRLADRGVVQAHQQFAALDGFAVVLGHLRDHSGHLCTQVGALFRLHRTGDDRTVGRRAAAAEGAQILGREQQHRQVARCPGRGGGRGAGGGRRLGRIGRTFAAGGNERGNGTQAQASDEIHRGVSGNCVNSGG